MSREASTIFFAAAAMVADVFALVVGELTPGFRGNGVGARSGSALSHLRLMFVSTPISSWSPRLVLRGRGRGTHMGTLALPLAADQECLCSRSRECSLDAEDMVSECPRNVMECALECT